ncbi:MAG: hypothetical protein GVY16_04180 [Planctomycetes bacterium]|jgi:hypothetical protein|nr:hypothetical protein [Planctomycetota bacterium]
MRALQSTLLRHITGRGEHHDWLFESPRPGTAGGPAGGLVCFRVGPAAGAWRRARRVMLWRLADHRRGYLTYQGAISRGRGRVRRVDGGRVLPRLWATDRAVLDVRLAGFAGTMHLRRVGPGRWVARID